MNTGTNPARTTASRFSSAFCSARARAAALWHEDDLSAVERLGKVDVAVKCRLGGGEGKGTTRCEWL
jgi:hypothetical protein